MADWDDEEFGGFESADIEVQDSQQAISESSVVDSNEKENTQSGILSWILASSPKSNASGEPVNLFKDVEKDREDLHPIGEIETDATPFKTDDWSVPSGNVQQEVSESNTPPTNSIVTTTSNLQTSTSEPAPTLEAESNLTGYVDDGNSALDNLKSAAPQRTAAYLENQDAIKALATVEPKIERQANDAILELTAKLDAMTILKEQTEKSLENLQEELSTLTRQTKEDLEKKNKEHGEDLERIQAQHQEEMKELQTTSEETIKILSQQYNAMWREFVNHEDLEKEANACSIVEKCVAALEQQKVKLSEKLAEDHASNQERIQEIFEMEREKMNHELSEKLIEEKQKMEIEMREALREEMKEEAKRMEDIHLSTLKEAMQSQQETFEKLMQATLKNEREKFSEVLKNVVEETRKSTEKSLEEKRKVDETRNKNHTMALKMLLTSALGYLDQKDDSELKTDVDQDSTGS